MNQVAVRKEQTKMGLLEFMADKYLLKPEQFRDTVRATCGLSTATPEQVAAFLIVASTYNLNPITKEIYAFPSRGGGIVPIVSVDGWANLVNSHPQCDGFEFEWITEDGDLGCTCRMFRKDRSHATSLTEWLSECSRATEPWKMKRRMLRHKAFIQASRLAFGFAGIYDEDEARNIIENEPRDVTPSRRVPSPSEVEDHGSDKYAPGDVVSLIAGGDGAAAIAGSTLGKVGTFSELHKDDPISTGRQKMPSAYGLPDLSQDYDAFFNACLDKINTSQDGGELETFWNAEIESQKEMLMPPDLTELAVAYGMKQTKLNADSE